jgi:hypothetical protein
MKTDKNGLNKILIFGVRLFSILFYLEVFLWVKLSAPAMDGDMAY